MPKFEIPLTPTPQNFQIALGSVVYRVSLRWCRPAQVWVLDLYNAANSPIIQGIPLVADVDLLEPYAYLGLGGKLVASTPDSLYTPPTFLNLGIDSHLYFITP